MTHTYSIYDPTGNITALVTTPVPVPAQAEVAAHLMEREPAVEQVGFLSPAADAAISLRMAGGEFCGNASMCAAAYWADAENLTDGVVPLRVSGAAERVSVRLSALSNGARRGTVAMPRPERIEALDLPGMNRVPVVFFDGIAHAILPHTADRTWAEGAAPQWARHIGADALGMLLFDSETNRLDPLVCVPAAGTLVWERSCASGTAAVGAYLANTESRLVRLDLSEPGGILTVEAAPGGAIALTGTVRLTKKNASLE